jgi:parallel beta-helix repeat protein
MLKFVVGIKRRVVYSAACLILTWVAAPVSKAQSVINVPADQPTVQAAINAANNGDTVRVAPGTYTENIDFDGKAIAVTSSGGPSVTFIDGGANGSVVTFNSGETSNAQLSGFTIRNGRQNGLSGGGIVISGASPTISGNVITANHAATGIGIYVNGGSPVIQNNTITANDQTGAGSGGQGGGGILIAGSDSAPAAPQITGNTITNNSVAAGGNGGGISVTYFSSPLIQGNLIQGNTAYNNGGGISLQSYNSPIVVQNVIVNNSALGGGSGGGVWVSPGSLPQTFLNNTIAGNTALDNTSGIFVTGFGQHATFTNNIAVAATGQIAVTCNSTYSAVSPFFSFNDAFSSSGQAWAGICDTTSRSGNISIDPLFVSATTDFHLQTGSPAVDAGDNSPANLPTTDFDGKTRIWDGNNDCVSTIDLGAYELQSTMAATISPTSLDFPSQLVGTTSSSQFATMMSVSTTCFQFASIQMTGDFTQTNTCPALGVPAGSACAFNISFAPIAGGRRFGSLIATSITGGSVYVALTGTGFSPAPIASFSPTSLDFPSQIVTTVSSPKTITVKNVGNAPMTINSISVTGDFAFRSGCGTSLAAGASCSVSVTFVPSAFGSRSGLLVISENADSSPQNLGLTGTGVDFYLNASPGSAAIVRGASYSFSVQLTPLGGTFANSVTLSCSGLPSHSSCTFSPVRLTPGSGGASSVMIVCTDKSKTPVGNYVLTVKGVSGTLAHTSQVQLEVQSKH